MTDHDEVAAALKRLASGAAGRVTPLPGPLITARGTRRRRVRQCLTSVACAVAGGSAALAILTWQPGPQAVGPVRQPSGSPSTFLAPGAGPSGGPGGGVPPSGTASSPGTASPSDTGSPVTP